MVDKTKKEYFSATRVGVPPLIAEACEYCRYKEHDHPMFKCMAYGGYFRCMWVSDNNVPWKCLSFRSKKVKIKQ